MSEPVPMFAIAEALQASGWLPWIRTLHIVGFSSLVGSVVIFDLRVLGLARSIPVRALAALCLPWAFLSLFAILPSGLLLFLARGGELLGNGVFLAKMGLLLVAPVGSIVFLSGPYRLVTQWNTETVAPPLARFLAATSLLVWTTILVLGSRLAA